MGLFPWGLKKEFEIGVVNEPLVFEPMKFYCIDISHTAVSKYPHIKEEISDTVLILFSFKTYLTLLISQK